MKLKDIELSPLLNVLSAARLPRSPSVADPDTTPAVALSTPDKPVRVSPANVGESAARIP